MWCLVLYPALSVGHFLSAFLGIQKIPGSEEPGIVGAPEGIRTPNLLIRSQMLYPLSHGRIVLCTLLNVTAFNSVMQIRVIQSPEIRLTSGFAEHQMRDTRPPRGIVDPNSRTFIRGTTSPTMHKARRPL